MTLRPKSLAICARGWRATKFVCPLSSFDSDPLFLTPLSLSSSSFGHSHVVLLCLLFALLPSSLLLLLFFDLVLLFTTPLFIPLEVMTEAAFGGSPTLRGYAEKLMQAVAVSEKKSRSAPEGGADVPVAIFLAGKVPKP